MHAEHVRSIIQCNSIKIGVLPNTVKPPKRGHFATMAFVLSSEVVLFSEVALFLLIFSNMYFSYFVGLYATGCMSYHASFTVMIYVYYINRFCR